MMNKRLVRSAIPTSLARSAESAVPMGWTRLHGRAVFSSRGTLIGWEMFPPWWGMTWAGSVTEPPLKLLQDWMPSTQVWLKFVSPKSPHFWNQAPPRAQQLSVLDFFMMPHLAHLLLRVLDAVVVVVTSMARGYEGVSDTSRTEKTDTEAWCQWFPTLFYANRRTSVPVVVVVGVAVLTVTISAASDITVQIRTWYRAGYTLRGMCPAKRTPITYVYTRGYLGPIIC